MKQTVCDKCGANQAKHVHCKLAFDDARGTPAYHVPYIDGDFCSACIVPLRLKYAELEMLMRPIPKEKEVANG